jgi:hypothetical protein
MSVIAWTIHAHLPLRQNRKMLILLMTLRNRLDEFQQNRGPYQFAIGEVELHSNPTVYGQLVRLARKEYIRTIHARMASRESRGFRHSVPSPLKHSKRIPSEKTKPAGRVETSMT